MSRVSVVVKAIAEPTASVRGVATSTPMGTTIGISWGADSQNVTLVVAGGGGKQADADQLEELDVVAVGYPVEPVEELVGHVGERLDQGDAGVGDVVVRPLRAAPLDQPLGVVDQVLEAAVVQVGCRQRHSAYSSSGIT